ncbi:MAG: 30S ribosomal protein S8 [bacterium]
MNDTISDLLTRISNAKNAGKASLNLPYSKIKMGILEVLKTEGYIGTYSKQELSISIDLTGASKDFTKIRRLSRPGRREYVKSKNITFPKGYGLVILSTPQGVLSGRNAKKSGTGGELICEVY